MKGKSNKKLLYFIAFLLPILLYTLVFAVHHIYPFGDSTVMTGDMRYQFVDYLSYLKTILFGNNDLNYSFSKNLGGSMAGFSAYYFASPMNLITLLFPSSWLPVAESLIILLTLGLSACAGFHLLAEVYGADKRLLPFSTAYALSGFPVTYFQLTMYSASLILFPLIVLGIIRIVKNPRRKGLYFWTLFLAVLSNYYSGFMICIFSALFFGWLLLLGRKANMDRCRVKELFTSFALTSILAVMLTAVELLPAVLSLKGEKDKLALGFFQMFPIHQLPTQLYTGSFKGNISYGLPNIFCGILVAILFFFYILDRRFSLRERVLSGGFFLFLCVNMWMNMLNVIWHGLNHPIGFPYRYSFMVSLFMIFISCREFLALTEGKRAVGLEKVLTDQVLWDEWPEIFEPAQNGSEESAQTGAEGLTQGKAEDPARAGAEGLIQGKAEERAQTSAKAGNVTFKAFSAAAPFLFRVVFPVCGLFLAYSAYLILSHNYCIGKKEVLLDSVCILLFVGSILLALIKKIPFKAVFWVFFTVELLDLTYNASDVINYFDMGSFSEYRDYVEKTEEKIEQVRTFASEEETDPGFYRLEKFYRRSHNDPMQFNYAGLSHFSSSEKKDKIKFLGKLGFRDNGNWSFYNEASTKFIDCFFGIRYFLSQHDYMPNRYKMIAREKKNYIFRNADAMPLVFACNSAIRDIDYRDYINPFALQEDMANSLNGKENGIFEEAERVGFRTVNLKEEKREGYTHYERINENEEAYVEFTLVAPEKQNVLAYFDAPHTQNAEIIYEDYNAGGYFSTYRWNILNMEDHREAGEFPVKVRLVDKSLDLGKVYFYVEKRENVTALMEELKENPSYLQKITSSHLKGNVSVSEEKGCVLLTIPYDKQWKVLVDGERVETKPAVGMLLSFDAHPGSHELELVYSPEGETAGRIMSLLALLLAVSYWIREMKKTIREKRP
ncbi:MAG: YfhO family protein [Lachnospiraceae bacterium]|nr:YfhO family protein [Lachnospiraceae bacterium]